MTDYFDVFENAYQASMKEHQGTEPLIARRAGIAALTSALVTAPQEQAREPVAWRWKPKTATLWRYDPNPEWLKDHINDVDAEPLYSHSRPDRRDDRSDPEIIREGKAKWPY